MAEQEPEKEYMTYCGEYEIREGGSEHGSDGINGTIVAPQSKIKAAGAGAGEEVLLLVEANGESITVNRKIHQSGNTLTIPLKERKKLNLSPGDKIEFWLNSIEEETEDEPEAHTEEGQETLDETSEDAGEEVIAIVGNSLTYHFLEDEESEKTVCGESLKGKNYRVGKDPGDILDTCHDCKAHSSKPMTNEEIVNWLSEEVGFSQTDGPPAYFNKKQLQAIKDGFVDLKRQLKEVRKKNREYSGRIGRLQQRIDEVEDN